MTGLVAPVLIALAIAVAYWAISPLLPGEALSDAAPQEAQPPDNSDRCVMRGARWPQDQRSGWLPVTRPAPAALTPPWAPRVCAGRVTTTERIRALYDAADRPVSDYLAGCGWPAQEVTAWA